MLNVVTFFPKMTSINTKNFRSPYRDIDLKMLRLLCDLHPWSLGELCKSVDLEQSALSMVFSGKRPLPIRIAKRFLQQIGMREDGSLDPDHGFVFVEKPGLESDLVALFARMYPEKAGVVFLNSAAANAVETSQGTAIKVGRAFFDGNFAAILHGGGVASPVTWGSSERISLKDYKTPEVLLSTATLPTKIDILKAFAGSKFLFEATWEDVLSAGRLRNVEPKDVLTWITVNYPVKR